MAAMTVLMFIKINFPVFNESQYCGLTTMSLSKSAYKIMEYTLKMSRQLHVDSFFKYFRKHWQYTNWSIVFLFQVYYPS